jgi:hypothetical protein
MTFADLPTVLIVDATCKSTPTQTKRAPNPSVKSILRVLIPVGISF